MTGSLRAETFRCKTEITGYDVFDPTVTAAEFEPGTELQILDYVASERMFRVRASLGGGKHVDALCRPEDLERTPPETVSDPTPAKPTPEKVEPVEEADPEGQMSPPIFKAVSRFDKEIWQTGAIEFIRRHADYGFKWDPPSEMSLCKAEETLEFLKFPVLQTNARFEAELLGHLDLVVFDRSLSKLDFEEEQFNVLLTKLEKSISIWFGDKGVDAWTDSPNSDTKRRSWFKFPIRMDLNWKVTRNTVEQFGPVKMRIRFRPEYVRLSVSPYDGTRDIASLTQPTALKEAMAPLKLSQLAGKVKKESTGDVYLGDIPMVDQGFTGYCVAASAERVLRYYNIPIDPQEIQKVADPRIFGKNHEDMLKALRRVGARFSFPIRVLLDINLMEFNREVEAYNTLARRHNRNVIRIPRRGPIEPQHFYNRMDKILLREVRLTKFKSQYSEFGLEVVDAINKGVPLFWTVNLGWVKELPDLPDQRGGHMRMIIGYNKQTHELIYTDAWGAGHEFKRMPLEDAFFISQGLFVVLPNS
jgi:hypothetical protein